MALDLQDTIAAIASPAGPAVRGIIRISGTDTVDIAESLFQPLKPDVRLHNGRRPHRIDGRIQVSSLKVPLPAALMLWPTSRSYTGQPMAEFHTIGSPPLLDAVLEALFAAGARGANRGEFTLRAFMAGRIDLVQAEAVLGVIDASDHEELQRALTQLGGGITSQLASVRGEILSLLGDLEAGLDFVEEDIEFISKQQICDRLQQCLATLNQLATETETRLPSGYRRRVVLAGLPNAGKSTLFNCLVGTGKAIVSPVAGTTRDYLTAVTVLAGLELELIDTAGWETASGLIMQRAQGLRAEQLDVCDLVLWCTAADLDSQQQTENDKLRQQAALTGSEIIDVVTQIDRVPARQLRSTDDELRVSANTRSGIDELARSIQKHFSSAPSSRSELLASTAARCRVTLKQSITAIDAAIDATQAKLGDEVIALELRDALHQIATIMGEVYTDDILDHIFSNFCIGK